MKNIYFIIYGKGRKQFNLLRAIVFSVTGNKLFSSGVDSLKNAHMLYRHTIFCSAYIGNIFHITTLFQLFQLLLQVRLIITLLHAL